MTQATGIGSGAYNNGSHSLSAGQIKDGYQEGVGE